MIVAIQGSKKRKNNCIGVTALLSTMTSVLYNATTLVIQIPNGKQNEALVNDVLDKEKNMAKGMSSNTYQFKTTGIDSVLMECADVKELRKGLINEKSETFIKIGGEPLLSVMHSSESVDFEEISAEDFSKLETLLRSADSEYNYVFVLMPRNRELASHILAMSSVNIMCIPQSEKADVLTFEDKSVKDLLPEEDKLTHKDIYLITDFDEASRYTQKKIRSDYNIKKTFVCYHNVDYKDAYLGKDILGFVKKNLTVDEYDNNFMFITEMKRLIAEFALEELETVYEDLTFVADALEEYDIKPKENSLDEIDMDVEISERKRHFGKIKTKIDITEKAEDVVEVIVND